MIEKQPVYIFSVERSEVAPDVNVCARITAKRQLDVQGVPYKIVTGCYEGEREESYVVAERDAAVVFSLARSFQQESVLHLDSSRNASLVFLEGGERVELGRWREVKHGPLPDAYTVDHETGAVWAAG